MNAAFPSVPQKTYYRNRTHQNLKLVQLQTYLRTNSSTPITHIFSITPSTSKKQTESSPKVPSPWRDGNIPVVGLPLIVRKCVCDCTDFKFWRILLGWFPSTTWKCHIHDEPCSGFHPYIELNYWRLGMYLFQSNTAVQGLQQWIVIEQNCHQNQNHPKLKTKPDEVMQ